MMVHPRNIEAWREVEGTTDFGKIGNKYQHIEVMHMANFNRLMKWRWGPCHHFYIRYRLHL